MAKVTAYVYDITQGMAAQMSLPLIGKKIDLVPHTGIAVFGKEYFFGGGPQIGIPGQSVPVPVAQVLELGETSKTCEELEAYIRNVLALQHTEQNYDLLKHNCNHYADDVAKFLLDGKGLPSSIVNIAEEALSTPQGQSLRVMIENMERSMRSGGASMNPFGSAASVPSAPVAAAPAPADESFGELKVALSELAKNGTEVRRTALQMLLKMTKNVEDNPSEPKFRRIKMANQAFQKKVEAATGGVDVMMAAGWLPDTNEEGEDCWLLNDSSAVKQASVRKCLDDELKKLPAPPASPAPANTGYSMPSPPAPAGLPGLGGLGGGLPPGMANNPMMQQMMNNPGMMQQAQQMMQDPNMMAQVQQMMQNPQAMAQLQQMMGSGGLGGLGR